jgi:hypothetical protein
MVLKSSATVFLGTAVGAPKALNPDAPKNLTRAVVLSQVGNRPAKRRGA